MTQSPNLVFWPSKFCGSHSRHFAPLREPGYHVEVLFEVLIEARSGVQACLRMIRFGVLVEFSICFWYLLQKIVRLGCATCFQCSEKVHTLSCPRQCNVERIFRNPAHVHIIAANNDDMVRR